MPAKILKKDVGMKLLRFLEVSSGVILTVIGLTLAAYTVKWSISYIGFIAWRLPKGYLSWGVDALMAIFIFSIAMATAFLFLLANTLLRGYLPHRHGRWLIIFGAAGGILFMSSLVLYLATNPMID